MSLEKNDKLVWVDINELKPHKKNTNRHPKEQIERLAKIINYQGFRSPIVVSNLSGFIVAGHGRLEAAKKLGLTKVPVSYQDFEDEKMELAHLNADNAIALWAEIDMKAMTESLKEINFDLDLDFLGFKDFKLDNETKSDSGDEDNIPETKENEFGVKIGDVFQLGNHRVMCGDSTDEASVAKLMNGQKADMVFTDPPYGCFLSETLLQNKLNFKQIENDNMKGNDLLEFFKKVSKNYNDNLRDFGVIYWFFSSNRIIETRQALESLFKIKDTIVWIKDSLVPGRNDYQPKYEPLLYLEKVGKGKVLRTWNGERNKTNVWEFSREKSLKVHPTQKPIHLIEFALSNSSNQKDVVTDYFLGSGSTLIACEKTNRTCFGMELDPHYVSVIIKRWQDFTGKTAVKL